MAPQPEQPRTRRPADRRSRPQRWRNAVLELLELQAEYTKWLAALPEYLLIPGRESRWNPGSKND
jgi:hypothetical protein